MGLDNVLVFLGLDDLGVEVHNLPERLPVSAGTLEASVLVQGTVAIADPLAVYVFTRASGRRDLPDDTLGLGVWVPHGNTLSEGFLHQKFFILQDSKDVHENGPAVLRTEKEEVQIDEGIFMERQEGVAGIATGLVAEVAHAMAALQSVIPPTAQG